MYRPDQRSYLLYPNRTLARFTEKNNIPPQDIRRSGLMKKLIADGNRLLVERDATGRCHFNGSITNARDVARILEQLSGAGYVRLVKKEGALVLDLFERLFDHQSFTGRSGTFFGYEGLGCIYWHMVSKLLLAVQETFFRAVESGASRPIQKKLASCYYEIRSGIGDHKSPKEYGAFPMDPYSHTPAHTGARQPGLTGQVKEDILCRFGELGLFIDAGRISFRPRLLRRQEFLTGAADFRYYDVAGRARRIGLQAGSIGFTYCQVPVVYQIAGSDSIEVLCVDGSKSQADNLILSDATSRAIFDRDGRISRITVSLSAPP
jgi:hypothetical protein